MARKGSPTLGEVALSNLLAEHAESNGRRPGVRDQLRLARQAADAVSVIACLAIAAHRRDGDYSQVGYAAFWNMTERTAQRDWALFKRAFPGEQAGPERLARLLASEYVGRVERLNPASASGLPADLVAA